MERVEGPEICSLWLLLLYSTNPIIEGDSRTSEKAFAAYHTKVRNEAQLVEQTDGADLPTQLEMREQRNKKTEEGDAQGLIREVITGMPSARS